VPKKVRRAALRGALSLRREEGAITVVDEIELPEIKTRRVAEILNALSLAGTGVLIVIDGANETLERSARNLPNVGVLRVAGLNVYDVLRYPKLLITRAALTTIEDRLGEDRRRHSADSGEAAP
jgi:large subunit ribosomal protein L4